MALCGEGPQLVEARLQLLKGKHQNWTGYLRVNRAASGFPPHPEAGEQEVLWWFVQSPQ